MAKHGYVNISLSLPVGVWEVIGTTSAENGTSPGALIAQALAERYGAWVKPPLAVPENPPPTPATDATGAQPARRKSR